MTREGEEQMAVADEDDMEAVDERPVAERFINIRAAGAPPPALLRQILEGALLAAGKPLTPAELAALFEDEERPSLDDIRAALAAIAVACADRGFELREVASGFRFQVAQAVAPWVGRLWEEKPQRYSRALLETLALIAYRQPITRGDIEEIRGVAVATNITRTLLEREWVRIVGHKDVPGRPAMYATTRKFLDYFNLRNLDDLPPLAEIRDFDTLSAQLALDEAVRPPATDAPEHGDARDSSDEPDSNKAPASDDEPDRSNDETGAAAATIAALPPTEAEETPPTSSEQSS